MEILRAGAAKIGIQLNAGQLEQFESYFRELVEWNQKINLTAITDYEEVQVKHFLDSLTITLALEEKDRNIADVGAGAGFPGLPLKIWSPSLKMTLLEATGKKARFLSALILKLGLEGVTVVNARSEEAAHQALYREVFDVVVARGLAPMPALAELTLPLCRVGGKVIAPKKGEISTELTSSARAISALGGELRPLQKVDLEEFPEVRWLVVVDKVTPTPEKYPRRSGIPTRRPIL